ncbi:jg1310 [Pararge aegeria aegeria]|uniref:Jg1310 protein n=1 Tax=Pararge aegeria aegeria TaxID=348720 RepID=A0A8S4QXK0_9NEOP|nr:jg1310 [Pararge aegeria aegeria]
MIAEWVGIFPDAYDCRKFHLCSPPDGSPDGRPAEHRTALCPRHYGYDAKTAQCSIQLQNGQCSQRPVPNCVKVGQFGVLEGSPHHYYVCISRHGSVYPQIFICPHGWHFWDTFCRPEAEVKREMESKTTEALVTSTSPIPVTYKVNSFFSTEKATTYAADTFLADKFDMTNYESIDDPSTNSNYEFTNSFENSFDAW